MPSVATLGIGGTIAMSILGTTLLVATADEYFYLTTGEGLFAQFKKGGSSSNKQTIEQSPALVGSKNQSMKDKPIPYILGSSYFSPLIMGNPYTTIEGVNGETQWYNVLLCCGYNDVVIDHIRMGNIEIASNRNTDKTIKKTGSELTLEERLIPIDTLHSLGKEEIKLELVKSNQDSGLYPQKIVDEVEKSQLIKIKDEDSLILERTSARYPQKIEVQIDLPALIKYSDKGEIENATAEVKCEYSFDEQNWNPLYFEDDESEIVSKDEERGITIFNGNLAKELRYVASKEFSYEELFNSNGESKLPYNVVYIRCYKLNDDEINGKSENKVYLTNIRTWVYDNSKTKENAKDSSKPKILIPKRIADDSRMEMTTRLAVRIKATENTKNYFENINLDIHSLAPIYLGNGEWGNMQETNNPASQVYKLFTHSMLGRNKVPEPRIDKYALGQVYEFCKEKGFECNGIVLERIKLSELVGKILSTCRSFQTVNGGQYSFFVDKRQSLPCCVLNNHNILNDGLSNRKNFGQKLDGVRVSFINKDIGYQKDTITAYRRGVNPETDTDLNLTDINMDFVTSQRQAYLLARFELAKALLRPETWNRKVGSEGNIFGVGNMLTLQDDSLLIGIGNGGIVRDVIINADGKIEGFITDTKLEIADYTKSYGVKIQHADVLEGVSIITESLSFSENGYFNQFTFTNPIDSSLIAIDDLVSFGELGKETTDVICISKQRDSDGNFNCIFLPYSDDIYNLDDDDEANIPEFDSNVTKPHNEYMQVEQPARENVTLSDVSNVRDYATTAVMQAQMEASPIYVASFNTDVIRYGNDKSYSPRVISANGEVRRGDKDFSEYKGTWKFFINNVELIEEREVNKSFIEKDVQAIANKYGEFDSIRVELHADGDDTVIIGSKNIPILSGSASYSVILSNQFQTYEVDDQNRIVGRSVKSKARVFYGLKELTYLADDGWSYGEIKFDETMFNVTVNYESGEITITTLSGVIDPAKVSGNIEVSVFIKSSTNTYFGLGYVDGVEEVSLGYDEVIDLGFSVPDENGYYYQYFGYNILTETSARLSELNDKVDGYWNRLTNDLIITPAENNTLKRLVAGIKSEFEVYQANYSVCKSFGNYQTVYNELINAVNLVLPIKEYHFDSESAKDSFNQKFANYYTAKGNLDKEIATTSTNFKGVNTVEAINNVIANGKAGDYFVWAGSDGTVFGSIRLSKGMTYKYNGSGLEIDNDSSHVMATMNEALELVSQSTDENIPAVVMAKRIIAMQVVVQELYSKFANIESLASGQVVIGGHKNQETGEVESFLTPSDVDTAINNVLTEKNYDNELKKKVNNALENGKTIVKNGYFNSEIVDVDTVMSNDVIVKNQLRSEGLNSLTDENTKGFFFDKDGNVRINDLYASNGHFSGEIHTTGANNSFKGKVEADSGTFKGRVEANEGFFKGRVEATEGYFSGEIDAQSGNIKNVSCENINISDSFIDMVSGTSSVITERIKKGIRSFYLSGSFTNVPLYFGAKASYWVTSAIKAIKISTISTPIDNQQLVNGMIDRIYYVLGLGRNSPGMTPPLPSSWIDPSVFLNDIHSNYESYIMKPNGYVRIIIPDSITKTYEGTIDFIMLTTCRDRSYIEGELEMNVFFHSISNPFYIYRLDYTKLGRGSSLNYHLLGFNQTNENAQYDSLFSRTVNDSTPVGADTYISLTL